MNSLRYLNSVLTVIVLLMAFGLWTRWMEGGSMPSSGLVSSAHAAGIPDAGGQRKQIVDELKRVSNELEKLTSMFRSGQARVRVDSPSQTER